MRRTIFIILILTYFHPYCLIAQAIKPDDIPQEWLMRVDLFDDFIQRFNWEEAGQNRLNKWITHSLNHLSKRNLAILSLCDHRKVIENKDLKKFATYVSYRNLKLDLEKNCVPVVTLAYKNNEEKEVDVTLTFKLINKNNILTWIITKAESSYFNYGDKNRSGIISYSDNELGFMCMRKLSGGNSVQLAGDRFKGDGLSVFLFLTANNFLKYTNVKEQKYILYIGDYVATVRPCEPKDHNRKGLLITNLIYQNKEVFSNNRN